MAMESDESGTWGHCIHCRFFGEHGAEARTASPEERRCHQPELERFDLVVTESSGCNHFSKPESVSPEVEEPATPPRFPDPSELPSAYQ